MEYRVLTIKGAILNKTQLEEYLEQIAVSHNLQETSNKNTYPIPRLKENFEVITEVYKLLSEHIKLKIPIHPAGEWLLDNYYIIEQAVKNICHELTLKKYIKFIGISSGVYSGFARIYVLSSEIINYSNNIIDDEKLQYALNAYQKKKSLSMEEIWNIGIFLRIAIIENIRGICEKIYSNQIQKYKVENIIERFIENKEKIELKFNNIYQYKEKVQEFKEIKYPFIEYLSYRLKKYGRKAYPFLNILEEQVNKLGTNISSVVEKEHFDVALRKIEMGNCITSIKTLNRINVTKIFEQVNQVEDILKKDPAKIYELMDYETKENYRNSIKEISRKTKTSEIYIANKVLELCKQPSIEKKKTHIGYYLIGKGKNKLIEILTGKKIKVISNTSKLITALFIIMLFVISTSLFLSMHVFKSTKSIILTVLTFISVFVPIKVIYGQVFQYILGKIVKPKKIPKLNYLDGIPKDKATFVVIPTILTNKEKVKKIMDNLEVFYLANKSENIYFALLGDCSSEENEQEKNDAEIMEEGIKQVEKLNKKYPYVNFPKFHFIYRKRVWNEKENCYLGWERKRGLLNQFNEYILKHNQQDFLINTINQENLPPIRYVITLDADTKLVLNSGLELIGAMSHILNEPVLNDTEDLVIDGYGIIQPRIGISLENVMKSKFTQIFGGNGGKDAYTNAISDIYQDNFGEGIFTGKGIYDVKTFSKVLNNEIPENTVLSHDLLEGSYLRCGLATDIMLLDDYPTNYLSSKNRLSRWTRGDWQILRWLKINIVNRKGQKKKNPLTLLSKYKIVDNLIRSLNEISIIFCIMLICILNYIYSINLIWIAILVTFAAIIPMLLEIIDNIVFRQEETQKLFTNAILGIKASFSRLIIQLGILPDKAYNSLNAITKTIYRLCISKKHLLEWTTSEEAEKLKKNDILSYYINMKSNVIIGILGVIYVSLTYNLFICFLSILWLIAPYIMWSIGRTHKKSNKLDILKEDEKEYLIDIGKRTWQFFKDYITEETNYLPPDNYQEDRKNKIVFRTSSTNIGLGLLAVVTSYDLKYESLEDTITLLEKMLNTISTLQKWNGHLYNWYDLKSLEPLKPRYISTVDSGNFIGYIFVLKQFLSESKQKLEKENKLEYVSKISNLIQIVDSLINNTDFSKLFDSKLNLFSIGYNIEESQLTDSYYDLLASEARQASFIAISKKDVPSKHWYNLSRTLTVLNKYKGLISWSGTAFEYWMPNINMPQYAQSLLYESSKFMLMCQEEYAKKLNIPWGFSEAAFFLKDLHNNYQYKAFGIPWIGLKRGLADDIVVASYASILALPEEPKKVIENLKKLEKNGMKKKYGFYESIDYTSTRLNKNQNYAIVKTYMAHHQGLILLSINNLFNEKILQKRFMKNPELKSVDILLQEKMPENVIITKEEKEKVEKTKYTVNTSYFSKEITKPITKLPQYNVISNQDYLVVMDSKGQGYSKYKDILINRYKKTSNEQQGIIFYFKNVKNNRIWTSNYMNYLAEADKYKIEFSSDKDKITRQDGNIQTITTIGISPENPMELRKIELINNGIEEETIEITSFLEPVLSNELQDYSHPAFNKMFLKYEYVDEIKALLLTRKTRAENEKQYFMGVKFYTPNETIGDVEYEIDKEKFYGRNNLGLPNSVNKSVPFTNQVMLTTEPIISLKYTITIKPKDKVTLYFITAVSEDKQKVIDNIKEFTNPLIIDSNLELSRIKAEEENKYLEMSKKDLEMTQKILGYLVYENPLKKLQYNKNVNIPISDLWQYGISGDLPIILVTISEIDELEMVNQIIKIYEYLKVKNIFIDLVFINTEKYKYESNIREAIYSLILNKNLAYLENVKGGFFILENISKEEIERLQYRANIVLKGKNGSLYYNIKELEEEYLDKMKEMPKENKTRWLEEEITTHKDISQENLLYNNEYGGFSPDGKEYHIRINKENPLPTVWSHILVNKTFGTLLTEGIGGYTWYKNSRLNRLTTWNNQPVADTPSEIIYVKDEETQKMYSIGYGVCPDENDYDIIYGFGYARYIHNTKKISEKMDVFIPREENIKVQIIELNNNELRKKKIKLIYYLSPVMGEDELKSYGFLNLKYYENSNTICMENLAIEGEKYYLFVGSSEKITSYTGSKKSFIGKGSIQNPDGVHQIKLDDENSLWEDGIIAITMEVELGALENKKIILSMGVGKNELECQDLVYKYNNISNVCQEYKNTVEYWSNLVDNIQVKTPIDSMNILLNGWLIYQIIASRMLGKTGYYQSGGALGFRDQLQDSMALKYIHSDILKNQILVHSKHQFIEGDVEHWWHEENNKGIRTKFTDDRLWLVYAVEEYISLTGDISILDENTSYIIGDLLEKGVDERYAIYLPSKISENIYEHCKKAINISLNFGKNGLPKIGSGDWNDGFSTVGNKGKGESVWLGFFIYKVLKDFIPICKKRNDEDLAYEYEKIAEKLKKALNTNGWDGRWYKRAFMDDGNVLGSIQNEECKIDAIAQSWSIISGAGDNDKKYISMQSLENHLVDNENGIIKLLDPPFDKSNLEPGYIKAYIPRNKGKWWTIHTRVLLLAPFLEKY